MINGNVRRYKNLCKGRRKINRISTCYTILSYHAGHSCRKASAIIGEFEEFSYGTLKNNARNIQFYFSQEKNRYIISYLDELQ